MRINVRNGRVVISCGKKRYAFKQNGNPLPASRENVELKWEDWKIVAREARARLRYDFENATNDPTFDRLKIVHPEASDSAPKRAIGAAVKLDQECTRYFSYASPHCLDDIDRAMARARQVNPAFREETYRSAWHDLAHAMR